MSVTDLSFTGFGSRWGHTRIYNNQLSQDYDFSNGWNWMVPQWGYLVRKPGGVMGVVRSVRTTVYFEEAGGDYVALYGAAYTLTHDATAKVFRMQVPSGAVWEFHDFDQTDAPKGMFSSMTSPGGQTLAVVAYSGGRISEVRRSEGDVTESLAYTYTDGSLTSVLFSRIVDSVTTQISRVQYSYYQTSDPNGLPGDLRTATREQHDGTNWVSVGTYYYRYYKTSAGGIGFPHGLKFALEPQAFADLSNAPGVTDPFTASDSTVGEYADYYFEYGAGDRVTKERISAGTLEYSFGYTTNAGNVDGQYNNWKTRTVETRPDGSEVIVFTNFLGQPLLRALVSSSDQWIEGQLLDESGHLLYKVPPALIADYTYDADGIYPEYRFVTGAIQAREYYGETDVPNGKVKGYVSAEKLLKSPTLEEVTLREFRYSQHSPAGSDLVVTAISEQIEYPHEASTADPIVTSWEYEYHPDTVQIKQRTTILPAIPTSQNGSGIVAEKRELYDINGYLIATQDERGFINTFEYDPTRGLMLRQVIDDDAPAESDWTENAGTRLKLTTDFEYDSLGRQTQSLGPSHNVNGVNVRTATWTVFDDEDYRTLSGRGYATGSSPSYTYTLVNPVQVTLKDADGRLLDAVQSIRPTTSGRLAIDDLDDLIDQANWCRWTRQIYNQDGTLQKTRVYHDILSTGEGALGTNYLETEFSYDEMHRRNRVISPAGTITWTVFDVRGLPIQTFVGTNDEGGSDSDPTGGGSDPDNNMTLVAENEYDNGLSGYNGNLTQEVRPVDENSSNNRTTAFGYDYRNRQIWIDGEVDFYRKSFYDNLNRVYQVDQYDTTDTGDLVARQATAHDDRGRVYRTTRYAVDPSDGSVGSNPLVDNTWFDATGNTIKSLPTGSQLFTKSLYDGAGRMTAQYQGIYTESGTEPYADVGEVTSDNTIFEQTISTYDEASNLIRVEHYQRFHDATGEGVLNGPSGANPKARVAYQGLWYDGISRSIATANYGTIPPDPWPTSPPSSSDTVLVSQTSYNQRGEAFATNDPAGTTSQTTFDDAGRAIEVVQDVNDLELTTTMTYHASGQIATLTALNADTGDQVTTYSYGSTLADSKIASNELLVEMEYPEGETASYAYDRQTERIKFTDPNATVHEYGYDALGRLVSDRVTTVGSGGGVIDATVLRIERSYEVRGLLRKVTSYSAASSGSVVNDVEMTYNDFGQLVSDVQEHGGSVGGGSPRVQYAYADGSGNTIRLTQVTYPDGTVLTYDYGTSGGASDHLSRVDKISWS